MKVKNIFFDSFGYTRIGWVFAGFILAIVSVLGILFPVVTHFQIVNDRHSCYTYGAAANREVKFVRLTFGSDVCLTKNAQGQWVDINNIRAITNGGK